jgi:long-chain acyl-CoA synthetase
MYSVEVEKPTCPNRTGIMRRAAFKNELISNLPNNDLTTCWDIFLKGWNKNRNGNCLGRRVKDEKGVLGEYEWLTYDQVKERALKFGSAILDLQLVKLTTAPDELYPNARSIRFLSVCSANCIECFICEQAANAYGLTLLPLYDTFGIEALQYIVNEAEITSTCCSVKCIPTLLAVAEKCPLLTTFIVFDSISTELEEKIKKQNITVRSFSTLMSWEKTREVSPGNSGDISTLCYTSGSTGKPKGVLLAQSNYIAFVSSVLRGIVNCPGGLDVSSSDIHISYLPLAHVFERSICSLVISLVCYASEHKIV